MGPVITAALYALAAVTLVGISIFQDSTQFKSKSVKPAFAVYPRSTALSHTAADDHHRLAKLVEFGVFGLNHPVSAGVAQLEARNSSIFRYNVRTADFPEWLPSFLQNGWAFVGIAIILCSFVTFVLLGPDKIRLKFKGWAAWFERTDHIQRGLVLPQFPIHVISGIYSVLGPIFVLRNLELNVGMLGALVFAEHSVQVLTQYFCGSYCKQAGNKNAQLRAVQLFFLMSFVLILLPFPPIAWVKQHPWILFACYFVARMLFAWAINQFGASFHSAINNSAFLPPADIVKTLDMFFAFQMLGTFIGAVLTLTVSEYVDIRWAFCLPLLLTGLMLWAVQSIPQDENTRTFPDDPADISAVDSIKLSQKAAGGEKPPIDLGGSQKPPWVYPIWTQPESRLLLIQFIIILLLFTSLETSFTFMLPLAAMNIGLTDDDVGFLVAMIPIIGLMLFWLGSAFDHTSYVLKGVLTSFGYAVAYFTAYTASYFTGLFLAAFIFALTLCYSCDLVVLLRICYLHRVSRYKMKGYFAGASGYSSHLVAFNAPLITLIMSLFSVHMAYLVWGALALFAAVWIGVIVRETIEEVTNLNQIADGDVGLDEKANAIFDEIDTNKDQVLSREELLAYLHAKLPEDTEGIVMDGILRITDRNGDGSVNRSEWRKSYAAIVQLARDEELGEEVFTPHARRDSPKDGGERPSWA